MDRQPTTSAECQFLGEFVDDAIPARGALAPRNAPPERVREVWAEVIRRNTTPVEGGPRLQVTPGPSGGAALAVVHFGPGGRAQALSRAEGEELELTSDQFLLVYRHGGESEATPETSARVLWQDIQYIEFCRRPC